MSGLRMFVDRFEGNYAVLLLDDGQKLVIPRSDIPPQAGEGSVLKLEFTVDEESTEKRKQEITDLIDRLKHKDA